MCLGGSLLTWITWASRIFGWAKTRGRSKLSRLCVSSNHHRPRHQILNSKVSYCTLGLRLVIECQLNIMRLIDQSLTHSYHGYCQTPYIDIQSLHRTIQSYTITGSISPSGSTPPSHVTSSRLFVLNIRRLKKVNPPSTDRLFVWLIDQW